MTKPLNKTIQPVPEDAQSHKGPGSTPSVPLDTTGVPVLTFAVSRG